MNDRKEKLGAQKPPSCPKGAPMSPWPQCFLEWGHPGKHRAMHGRMPVEWDDPDWEGMTL